MPTAAMLRIFKKALQQTIGQLPPPKRRFDAPLAIHGGTPVRDKRLRPWSGDTNCRASEWSGGVRDRFREVFLSGSEGLPQTKQKEFAARWAEFCGCKHALMLPHGTDALRFGLAAAFDHDGLDYGGEVIVPNLSFVASATSALDRRFGVALVDVEHGTLNIDPVRVEEAIVPGKTCAIMPVHQFGQAANMTALRAIAKKHGLKIIEDAAQAHGAAWEGKRVGSWGDAAAFSFQSAKNLSCGEGGMLTTDDAELFDRAYRLHNAGRSREAPSRWEHESIGWNCRATEYQATLVLHRFGRFEAQQETRAKNFASLRKMLQDVSCVRQLEMPASVTQHGMYMFSLCFQSAQCGGISLAEFMRASAAEGAPINRCYAHTLSDQPAMKQLLAKRPDYIRVLPTPVADQAVQEILYIAADVFLGTEADMADIAGALRKIESHYRNHHQ